MKVLEFYTMSAPGIERPFDKVLTVFGIPTAEQKSRIFANVLRGRMSQGYWLFPDRNPGRSSILTFPRVDLESLDSPVIKKLIEGELNGAKELQIQTKPAIQEEILTGASWLAVKGPDIGKRVKFSFYDGPGVSVSTEEGQGNFWQFLEGFESINLQELSKLMDFALTEFAKLHPKRAQLLPGPVPLK